MNRLSRRQWLKLGAAGRQVRWRPLISSPRRPGGRRQAGANERVGIGAIGVGGRASLLLNQLPPSGQIVALCDCNLPRAEGIQGQQEGRLARLPGSPQAPGTQRHRRGDRGHGANSSGCCPASTPARPARTSTPKSRLTLYIREGRVLVDAVRRYGRVFQVGTQQRSMAMNRIACELVRSGGLGKVMEVLALNYPELGGSARQGVSRGAGAGRAGLGRVAEPGGVAALQRAVDGLDALARLLRRRNDQLGRAWHRSDPVGPGHGRDRPGGDVALRRGRTARSRCATPTACRCVSSSTTARTAAASSSARRESWRSTATSSRRIPRRSPWSCSRRSTRSRKSGSGATRPPSGRPNGTCRTGSTASARGRDRWRTSRSAIARSACATW